MGDSSVPCVDFKADRDCIEYRAVAGCMSRAGCIMAFQGAAAMVMADPSSYWGLNLLRSAAATNPSIMERTVIAMPLPPPPRRAPPSETRGEYMVLLLLPLMKNT